MNRGNKRDTLTQERLKSRLTYDKETGIFRWAVNLRKVKPGDVAGSVKDCGYRQIRVDGHIYLEHRLAWLYETGTFPVDTIDHINRVKTDNRFSNLREATESQNHANKGLSSRNKSGHRGVFLPTGAKKWVAAITKNYVTKYLGSFDTVEEAAVAYQKAAIVEHGEFSQVVPMVTA